MDIKITPKILSGEVSAPPSKSYAHRLMIAAFLSGEKVKVKGVGESMDVTATLDALSALGAEYTREDSDVIISSRKVSGRREVYCRESGSTLRFLVPVAASLGINANFTGEKRLMERPLGDLINTLNERGADIEGKEVKGKLTAGEYRITAGVSSQYITGLLLALPLLDGDSEIILDGEAVSKGYIDITLDVLKLFSIDVERKANGFFVKGNQKYTVPTCDVVTEGDYSGAAFTLTAGAIGPGVTVKGLTDSIQGDGKIVEVLEKFGATVERGKERIRVEGGNLHGIDIDCENIPDLVQIISVAAAYAKGDTVLRNVDRLRIKESDRIEAVINSLSVAGIKAKYDSGNLYITGGEPKGGVFDGGNDHRTVMSCAILASRAKGESKVLGAEAVTKSYPAFFEDYRKLGGIADVEVAR